MSDENNKDQNNARLTVDLSNSNGITAVASSVDLIGDFVIPSAHSGVPVLRITKNAFIFKGEEITDAGRAYDAFAHAMNTMRMRQAYEMGMRPGATEAERNPTISVMLDSNGAVSFDQPAPTGSGGCGGSGYDPTNPPANQQGGPGYTRVTFGKSGKWDEPLIFQAPGEWHTVYSPKGATEVKFDVVGAGTNSFDGRSGWNGEIISRTVPTIPGDVFRIFIGFPVHVRGKDRRSSTVDRGTTVVEGAMGAVIVEAKSGYARYLEQNTGIGGAAPTGFWNGTTWIGGGGAAGGGSSGGSSGGMGYGGSAISGSNGHASVVTTGTNPKEVLSSVKVTVPKDMNEVHVHACHGNDFKAHVHLGLCSESEPTGEPQECVLGMTPIKIRKHRDDWMTSLDTEKVISPTWDAVLEYLKETTPIPYTQEQLESVRLVHNLGGRYGTGWVVIMNGNVIAHLSGWVHDFRKLDKDA